MINSETRIEIAEKMRGPFDVCECVGHTYLSGTIFGLQVCARDELELRNGMRYLADLIDPTCHAELKRVIVDDYYRNTRIIPTCSVCGSPLDMYLPRFCPNCGNRLVSNNGK